MKSITLSFHIAAQMLAAGVALHGPFVQAQSEGDVDLPSLDTRYDHWAYLATHNSFANPDEGFLAARSNQPESILDQLNYGVRVINLDIWLVRQRPGLLGCWIWEEYTGADTTPGNRFSTDDPLQVVLAHGLDQPTADQFHNPCDPWKTLKDTLDEMGAWLEGHPNEVVTLQFETKIDPAHEVQHIIPAINASRIAKFIFHPTGPNPNVPPPAGRTDAQGWAVEKYGYPTLRQLAQAGKRLVMFPPYIPRDPPGNPNDPATTDSWKLEVQTVYGHACLPPFHIGQHWILPRHESTAIDDFTRSLFSVVHVPDLPGINDYAGPGDVNDVRILRSKWEDIQTLYRRLPNWIWMDYYERGFNGLFNPGDPPAPALFVNELNAIWRAQPEVTATAQVFPAASAHGWHNTNVIVSLFEGVGAIRTITSRLFGATQRIASANRTHVVEAEGITTVSFSAVGSLGRRGPTELVDVGIDRTPPTISGVLDRPPDQGGWYTSNVTAHFECSDALSGVAFCMPDVVLSADGADQSVTGLAIDLADNQSTTTITNINIDTLPPSIRVSARPNQIWPPNGKLVPVVISGMITDSGSGVDPATASFSVRDEYGRVQPAGRLTLLRDGMFSLVLQLEARRAGADKNGRRYVVRLNATDRAGHSRQAALTIVVPHDQTRRPKG